MQLKTKITITLELHEFEVLQKFLGNYSIADRMKRGLTRGEAELVSSIYHQMACFESGEQPAE